MSDNKQKQESIPSDSFDAKNNNNLIENALTSVENSVFFKENEQNDDFSQCDEQNLQKSTIMESKNFEILSDSTKAQDPVSDFNASTIIKNSHDNIKFLSSEEDNRLFSRLFPGVDRKTLENDSKFKLFVSGKDKNSSFCSIYADYLTFIGEIRKESAMRDIVAQNNRLSSPGALSSPNSNKGDYFSKEQVQKMTREQIARNYIKIRESQQKW